MSKTLRLAFASLAALVVPAAAHAGSTAWDWDEDKVSAWTTPALFHAQDIIGGDPAFQDIIDNEPAPPLEPWCVIPDAVAPVQEDCEIHAEMVSDWHRDLLQIEPSAPLPGDLPAWPHSCPSICSQ